MPSGVFFCSLHRLPQVSPGFDVDKAHCTSSHAFHEPRRLLRLAVEQMVHGFDGISSQSTALFSTVDKIVSTLFTLLGDSLDNDHVRPVMPFVHCVLAGAAPIELLAANVSLVDDTVEKLEPGVPKAVDDIVQKIDETLAKGRIHPVVKDVLFLLNDEHGTWINDFPLVRLQQLQAVIL